LFDFIILWVTIVTAFLEALVDSRVTALRVIRTLRIVCVFRILIQVRGLQILIMAFFKTITEWVAPALLLLLIVMFIFAIISDHYFNSEEVWWGTIGRCLMSLISYFTVRIQAMQRKSFLITSTTCFCSKIVSNKHVYAMSVTVVKHYINK